MNRRTFLKNVTHVATIAALGTEISCASAKKPSSTMLPSESPSTPTQPNPKATQTNQGLNLPNFYAANIVPLSDGSLMTQTGLRSTDHGRTWQQSKTFHAPQGIPEILGLIRLPNGQLGTYYADKWTLDTALGNANNNRFFRSSADEGQTWSPPVKITLDGLTMGLKGTMKVLSTGRIIVVTYSQFIGSRFDQRGHSYGTLRGHPFDVESEGHFPCAEACRAYYSDDNGQHWRACDGWIMGWREKQTITDTFTEGDPVELADGRILLIGRALTGRLYQAFSSDKAQSWWPGAQPTELASSYSPARICRLPKSGDLMVLWNQISRSEIRKGLRRGRLSTAVSSDSGQTWRHFKNLDAIASLAATTHVPPDPDLSPVIGDADVGPVPDDFAIFHYPCINTVGHEIFISYETGHYFVGKDNQVQFTPGTVTRILPEEWFYTDERVTNRRD